MIFSALSSSRLASPSSSRIPALLLLFLLFSLQTLALAFQHQSSFLPLTLTVRVRTTRARTVSSSPSTPTSMGIDSSLRAVNISFGDQVLGSLENKPNTDLSQVPIKESTLQYQVQQQVNVDGNNIDNDGNMPLWKQKLLKLSDWASLLCVLDCTVLPIMSILFPLLGFVNGNWSGSVNDSTMAWLHALGHNVAWYFVLPVGTTASLLNYKQHKQKWIAGLALLGLLAVAVANSAGVLVSTTTVSCCSSGAAASVTATTTLSTLAGKIWQWTQHGIGHRLTNLAGCALLYTSNVLARQWANLCNDPNCTIAGCLVSPLRRRNKP